MVEKVFKKCLLAVFSVVPNTSSYQGGQGQFYQSETFSGFFYVMHASSSRCGSSTSIEYVVE